MVVSERHDLMRLVKLADQTRLRNEADYFEMSANVQLISMPNSLCLHGFAAGSPMSLKEQTTILYQQPCIMYKAIDHVHFKFHQESGHHLSIGNCV